jgi:hypothetical protein
MCCKWQLLFLYKNEENTDGHAAEVPVLASQCRFLSMHWNFYLTQCIGSFIFFSHISQTPRFSFSLFFVLMTRHCFSRKKPIAWENRVRRWHRSHWEQIAELSATSKIWLHCLSRSLWKII